MTRTSKSMGGGKTKTSTSSTKSTSTPSPSSGANLGAAKTRLVDGVRINIADGSYAQPSTDTQASRLKEMGITPSGGTNVYTPSTISSENLAPSSTINLPPPAPASPLGTQAMTAITGQLGAPAGSTPGGDTTPKSTPVEDLIKSLAEPVKSEDIYKKAEKEAGIVAKQQTVNNLQAQLGAITAKANADKLSLIGQGRGVTDVIIGGQQAQIDREAAIQSLPLAAQLSAAQNDLQSAQDHLDTLFKIRLQDAQAKADRKNKIAELVYNYATDQQKEALADRRIKDERAFTLQRDNINYARDLASTAISNGQPSLAASIMRLDPNSPTYAQDIASFARGISVSPKSSSTGGTEAERATAAIAAVSSKFVPGAMTPSGLTILNPSGYINPEAWKDIINHAPEIGLTRSTFISNFGSQLYIDPKTNRPSANYGLTPKEIKDLGYE